MSKFEGVIVSDHWLQSQFTQVQLRTLKSKFISLKNQIGEINAQDLPPLLAKLKPFNDIFKEKEIGDFLSESGLNLSNGIDFEGFLRAYLNLNSQAAARLGNSNNSSSFLQETTTTMFHTIDESERESYVAHINSYLRDDPFMKQFFPIDGGGGGEEEIEKLGFF